MAGTAVRVKAAVTVDTAVAAGTVAEVIAEVAAAAAIAGAATAVADPAVEAGVTAVADLVTAEEALAVGDIPVGVVADILAIARRQFDMEDGRPRPSNSQFNLILLNLIRIKVRHSGLE